MKKCYLNLNKKFLLMFLLIVFGIFGAFLTIKYVKASDKPFNYGYFYNVYFTNNPETGPSVIAGGIPGWVDTKQEFIDFIKEKYNNSGNNHVGAAYIIQTMRGFPWDHSFPDSSDIADWENKINNPNITVGWIDPYARKNLNSTITPGSITDVVEYDAGRTNGLNDSIVFYNNSTPLYAIQRSCGNPVGHLSGLSGVTTDSDSDSDSGSDSTIPDVCDPIEITVEPRPPYPAVSFSSAGGQTYYYPQTTIPVRVSTPRQNPIGTYSSKTVVDITAANTTGDVWTVTYAETSNHVVSYTDLWRNGRALYRNGDPIYRNGDPIYDEDGDFTGEYKQILIGYEQIPTGEYKQIFIGYEQIYNGTRTNYAGPNTWTSTIGSCYDYNLTASAAKDNYAVEADASINARASISSATHTGKYHTHSRSETQWQLVKLVIEPNVPVPSLPNSNSSTDPCGRLGYLGTCSLLASGGGVVGTGGWSSSLYPVIIGDEKAGTKVCFASGVRPRAAWHLDHVDGQWNHSSFSFAESCIIVVKKPKVQIWGSDLSVGGLVKTSTSVKNLNSAQSTFGSWVEYGIFATNKINGMGSGSAFAGSAGLASATIAKYSTLSFANSGNNSECLSTNPVNANTIGCYTNTMSIPDVVASFSAAGTTISGTVAPNSLNSGIYTAAGNLTLTRSELAPGKSVILKVSGTVTIAENQTYNPNNNGAKYTSILQLPQLVIIADKIIINGGVTNVDAWLIAKGNNGTIATCEIVGDTINNCNAVLTVNGPVMANKLYLRRTAGSDTKEASGDPSEIFNLRADTYLWAIARATSSGRIQTVYTTELPPRF